MRVVDDFIKVTCRFLEGGVDFPLLDISHMAMGGSVRVEVWCRGMRLEVNQVRGISENEPGRAGVLIGIGDDYPSRG